MVDIVDINIKKLAESLSPLERKVLPYIQKYKFPEELAIVSGLKEVEVVRALQWLQNKQIIQLQIELKELIFLEENGKEYVRIGLPETRFIKALEKSQKSLSQLQDELSKEEINSCIGVLRSKNILEIKKDKELVFSLTKQGVEWLKKDLPEEKFLAKEFPVDNASLSSEEKEVLESLKKRKQIVSVVLKKIKKASLTPVGENLLQQKIEDNVIERLTPQILRDSSWKKKSFRRYDVSINVPQIHGGKLQVYRKFLDGVRKKFQTLGFQEMNGPLVESDFWDMDALFMPQFHSARDIHEAYYIKEPKFTEIDPKIIKHVKEVHENGSSTGSKGWRYQFDVQRTKRLLLRTQGTACSSRMLANPNLQIPGKYFGITRCFRYDVIDATHLPDFNQVEGIVIEEGLTIKHLFGLLKMFAKEFANTEDVRIVPGYFPFTEPSAELFAKHPDLGWVELGGAGMFRPEVVTPLLGKYVPVLAWGLGVDRLGMFNLEIKDIRNLFSHDLEFLRESRII
ncbi:phenylalanine--tRNA ligase subunit alpha [Candidatus Woesearchaeota archaeon]|nr:phenylalanine--tRNA ligase subunit alpha [Candidatus Woesearchaeota archaeon]